MFKYTGFIQWRLSPAKAPLKLPHRQHQRLSGRRAMGNLNPHLVKLAGVAERVLLANVAAGNTRESANFRGQLRHARVQLVLIPLLAAFAVYVYCASGITHA
jgi:hypothetical protein